MKKNTLKRLGYQYKANEEPLTVKSESRTISGYAAVFNNKDRQGDVLRRGCFAKSIADRGPESEANGKILLLWQHNDSEPLGRIDVLKEDEHGLYFEATLDKVEKADQALAQLESGTLNQFSIGFSYEPNGIVWDDKEEAYEVTSVKLYEISIVSIAANPETEYLGLKCGKEEEQVGDTLCREAAEAVKSLTLRKQMQIQRLLRRAVALSTTPRRDEIARGGEKAAGTHKERESIFDIFV